MTKCFKMQHLHSKNVSKYKRQNFPPKAVMEVEETLLNSKRTYLTSSLQELFRATSLSSAPLCQLLLR